MLLGFGAAFDTVRRIERERQRHSQMEGERYDRRKRRRHHSIAAHLAEHEATSSAPPSHHEQIDTARQSERTCPQCCEHMLIIEAEGIPLDVCLSCGGIWFDADELKRLTHSSKDIPNDDHTTRRSKHKCPVCHTRMRQYLYEHSSNLWVDKCPNEHGVYLQHGELVKALEITTGET